MAKGERGEDGLDPNLDGSLGLGPTLLLPLVVADGGGCLPPVVVVVVLLVRMRNLGVEGLLILENKLNLVELFGVEEVSCCTCATTSWWSCGGCWCL